MAYRLPKGCESFKTLRGQFKLNKFITLFGNACKIIFSHHLFEQQYCTQQKLPFLCSYHSLSQYYFLILFLFLYICIFSSPKTPNANFQLDSRKGIISIRYYKSIVRVRLKFAWDNATFRLHSSNIIFCLFLNCKTQIVIVYLVILIFSLW